MATGKSFAMVQTAPHELEPREFALPELGDDDALLRVEACGICGSDVEQFEGVLPVPLPVVPGHEPLGVIEATTATRPDNLEGSVSFLGEGGSVVLGGFATNKVDTWNFADNPGETAEEDASYPIDNVYGYGHVML